MHIQVFTGLRRLEKPYHTEIHPTVSIVIDPPRPIPAALQERVKAELDDIEKRRVIRKVEESTDWVNLTTFVEKPDGSLRMGWIQDTCTRP